MISNWYHQALLKEASPSDAYDFTPALRLPDGEIVTARKGESIHRQIRIRLVKQNHPNVIDVTDPDVEDGWTNQHGEFSTRDEMRDKGYYADTWGFGRRVAKQLNLPILPPKVKPPTSSLPPGDNWHASRIVNSIIRSESDELQAYIEGAYDINKSEAQIQRQGLEDFRSELMDRYENILFRMKDMTDPIPVYRAINIPDTSSLEAIQANVDRTGFGECWSYEPGGAIPHSGGRGETIVLHAYAPQRIVNWRLSLELNVTCPEELELRLFQNQEILVYRVTPRSGSFGERAVSWPVHWRGKT